MSDIRPFLVGVCCVGLFTAVVIGAIVLLMGSAKRARSQKIFHDLWVETTGQIISANVEESVRMSPDEDQFYYPSVTFVFDVAGQSYEVRQAIEKAVQLGRQS